MGNESSTSLMERFGLVSDVQKDEIDVYDAENYRAFGVSRKPWGGEPMLNFVDCRGDQLAIAYNHLYCVKYNPSVGITIEFSDHIVSIRGRGLAEGYQKLAMQRVIFITEADRATAGLVGDRQAVITSLSISQKREKSLSQLAIDAV